MKSIVPAIMALLCSLNLFAQKLDTQIYLTNYKINKEGKYIFTDPVKITGDAVYNNQPYFTAEGDKVIFTKNPDTIQTDIYQYIIADSSALQISTSHESDYSPQFTPDGDAISVVRVDNDKAQRLYTMTMSGEDKELVLPSCDSVAYYCWLNKTSVAVVVLMNGSADLMLYDVPSQSYIELAKKVGRCLQNIPGTEDFIYTVKKDSVTNFVLHYNNAEQFSDTLVKLPKGVEDFFYAADGKIFCGDNGKLLVCESGSEKKNWTELADFTKTMGNFYRLAVSPKGNRIALVTYTGKKP